MPGRFYDAVVDFHQPKDYGFTSDSILLAKFADFSGVGRAADFGAGCGIVGLCALENSVDHLIKRMFFVEAEPGFFEFLDKNLALYESRCQTALTSLKSDWRCLSKGDFDGPLDCILCNPPYFPLEEGRSSPSPLRDSARRERRGNLADLVAKCAELLTAKGRLALTLPFGRGAELESLLTRHGFAKRRAQAAWHKGGKPRLLLLEALKL